MNVKSGLTAGFVATVVLSLLMMAKQAMGLMPDLDPIAMIAGMVAKLTGGKPDPIVGWVMHFFIGTVMWGITYSIVQSKLPGGPVARGMIFGIGAWLLMMVLVMPLAGAGFFGLAFGMGAPVATLMLHLVFGATLGIVYAKSQGAAAREDVLPR
jgi:uncharacterized membrane protein YagU involved in acid resistance